MKLKLLLSITIFLLFALIFFTTNAAAIYRCGVGSVCSAIEDCSVGGDSHRTYCNGEKVMLVLCSCSNVVGGTNICEESKPQVLRDCSEIPGFKCQRIREDNANCLGDSLKDDNVERKCKDNKECFPDPKKPHIRNGSTCKDNVSVNYMWVCAEGVCRQLLFYSQNCLAQEFDKEWGFCREPPLVVMRGNCHCEGGKCVPDTILTSTDIPRGDGGPIGTAFPLTLNGNLLIGIAGLLVLVSLITSFL